MTVQRNKAFLSLFQPGASHRDAALAYASYQLFVHPLRPGSKQPRLRDWQKKATTNFDTIKKWWPEGSKSNIGIYLPKSCVVVIDVDPRNGGDETFEQFCNDHGQLPPTYTVKTAGDGRHYYFRVQPDFYELDTTYPTQLGDGVEFLQNKYVVAPPSELEDGRQYTVSTGDVEQDFAELPFYWVDEIVRAQILTRKESWHDNEHWTFDQGHRNDGATKLAGYMRRIGSTEREIEETLHAHGERFANYTEDVEFREVEIPRIAKSIGNHRPAEIRLNDISVQVRQKAYKPVFELDDISLYGPLGDFVKFIAPYTEAHPAALLGQALTIFGNMIGGKDQDDPGPGFTNDEAHHKTVLYTMIVGDSATGGKGDSWSRTIHFFKPLDKNWNVVTGIQSGEALINMLADAPLVVNNKRTKDGITPVDKRRFVFEPEFTRVVKVAQRQGSILKEILHALWDFGSTQSHAKSSVQIVSNATLSLVTHVTRSITRELTEDDLENGFANRFLYVYSERRQFLPFAESIPEDEIEDLRLPLRAALEFSRDAPENYAFTSEAAVRWEKIAKYWVNFGAKEHTPWIEKAMSGRARPAIRRMAVIYAIADCSEVITLDHLEAASAFWRYCFESTSFIFADRLGDPVADKLLRALREHPSGLTRAEIYGKKVFNFNMKKPYIQGAIRLLLERGFIEHTRIKEAGKRKPSDLYFIPQHESYEDAKGEN